MRGVAAMKEHIIETVAGGLVVLATALLLVYGSKFAWEVVKSDYNDHQELVASLRPRTHLPVTVVNRRLLHK